MVEIIIIIIDRVNDNIIVIMYNSQAPTFIFSKFPHD